MSKTPRATSEINEHLEELRSIIHEMQSFDTTDYATEVGIKTLQFEESILVEELKAAYLLSSDTALQISLDGKPVIEHAINSKFAGLFLATLQDLADALAQVSQRRVTKRGRVSRNVMSGSSLLLNSTMPTSFGLNFTMPDVKSGQLELMELFEKEGRAPELIENLRMFFDGEVAPEELTEAVVNSRVKKHYSKLINLISQNQATVQLRTRQNPEKVDLSARQAETRLKWIETTESTTKYIDVIGILTGANVRLNSFEIWQDERLYTGKMSDRATAWARNIPLGSRVSAEIRVAQLTHKETSVTTKTDYFLTDVTAIEEKRPRIRQS